MRSGGCALQQTLTSEAASVLKHSLVLARRRGHPQVTPLHVAITLLTLRLSSFKRACLKSHQPHHQTSHNHHPLQSRALELCFNVALNRLPTTPSPLIHSQPSLSNALIAALKRAQAHQRRGSIEQQQQQQTVLTVKVELEQLIISILDDPSVSRVMREAGFSSTLVKNNLEDSFSPSNSVFKCYNSSGGGVFSSPCSPSTSENHRENINLGSFRQNHFTASTNAKYSSSEFNSALFSPPKRNELMTTSNGLGLTLHSSSVLDSRISISQNPSHMMETKPFSSDKEHEDKLNCCEECASNYEKEAQFLKPQQKKILPFWLQSHGTEEPKKDGLTELKRKWNRLCLCLHQSKQHQNQNHWNWSNNNHISNHNNSSSSVSNNSNHTPRFRRQQSCIIEFNFNDKRQAAEPVFDSFESMEANEVKITLALGNASDSSEKVTQQAHVCKLLEENVPWQSETVPSIAKALIDYTKLSKQSEIAFTWLFLQGNDFIGKRRLALAIAESVFGSADLVLHMDMLKKETLTTPFSEMLLGALRTHQQLVVLIENIDSADTQFTKFLSDACEKGKFETLSSKERNLGQIIFILTNGGSTSIEEKKNKGVINLLWQITESKPNFSSPKRKSELDLFSKIKNPRIEENEKGLLICEQGSKKTEFLRQTSFNSNTLDLNMKADEEQEEVEESPNSSDLTRETAIDQLNSKGFLDSIENRFEFNTNSDKDREKTDFFLSRIKGSFEEVYGKNNVVNFSVDEKVVENMCVGCCFFTNKMFEKWLKDIFQRSLETVNFGGKEGILFRLCLGGGDRNLDSGFNGSCLPKSIKVDCFME
ncbi:protein SMAX1-LIKE 4-like [Vicia villosa]|uniref:protein SMAX1-LIKE 4-like n=1 Tax=Vicia villosa TaxID=3911 RepID=UPI00273B1651|nr:protein SMAX1-LIKE 4-like [Vicia villosa]XP_058755802.1 protein SMAX1-LIKE 4-like [Vicia villosa]